MPLYGLLGLILLSGCIDNPLESGTKEVTLRIFNQDSNFIHVVSITQLDEDPVDLLLGERMIDLDQWEDFVAEEGTYDILLMDLDGDFYGLLGVKLKRNYTWFVDFANNRGLQGPFVGWRQGLHTSFNGNFGTPPPTLY